MPITEFNESFLCPLLEKLSQENKSCFLMGDFNINLLNTNTNNSISDFFNLMCSNFFAPYVLQPTRITTSLKTLIDNIFLNDLDFSSYSGNLTTQISDHLISICNIK